jgi:hypothetical protein
VLRTKKARLWDGGTEGLWGSYICASSMRLPIEGSVGGLLQAELYTRLAVQSLRRRNHGEISVQSGNRLIPEDCQDEYENRR